MGLQSQTLQHGKGAIYTAIHPQLLQPPCTGTSISQHTMEGFLCRPFTLQMLENSVSAMADATIEHQPQSQATPITQDVSVDFILQPATGATQEVEPDHPVYLSPLLEYIEARQQVLLSNIGCCNGMLELLEQLLSVNRPSSTEAGEQCEKSDQNTSRERREPAEDPKAD